MGSGSVWVWVWVWVGAWVWVTSERSTLVALTSWPRMEASDLSDAFKLAAIRIEVGALKGMAKGCRSLRRPREKATIGSTSEPTKQLLTPRQHAGKRR